MLGVGLIGGSFALALRHAGFSGTVLGVSSPKTIARALELGVIDEGRSLPEALREADLVYMAQPVPRIVEQLPEVRRLVPSHALVTDAGSTKRAIMARARELFFGNPDFIGGHPMAGKAGRGVEIAEPDLFRGQTYALVPAGRQMPETPVVNEFRAWLDAMGCRTRLMADGEHDEAVAWTSHMPQLVSTALSAAIASNLSDDRNLEVAGNGLRDMTRLAESSYALWSGILGTNREAVDGALDAFIGEIADLRAALRSGTAEGHFERGRRLRARLEMAWRDS